MAIKEVHLSNFKSFYKASIILGNFNVVVGANASGKSNFIQFFKFIKDISEFGMDDAVSMQGGSEYMFNANHPRENILVAKIVDDTKQEFTASKDNGIGFEVTSNTYELNLHMSDKKTYIISVNDKFTYTCEFHSYKQIKKEQYEKSKYLGSGKIIISNRDGEVTGDYKLPRGVNSTNVADSVMQFWFLDRIITENRLQVGRRQTLLEADIPTFVYFGYNLKKRLQGISIFDIDPKLIKKAHPITGRHDLEPDGSNLAAVVRRLVKNPTTKRQMENVINDLLPFVEGISIKKLADNVIIRIKERFKSDKLFPAFLLSDGTINLTALSIVLFFENKPMKIIEEPERNIHPHLISRVMDLMRDASEESQIITTTHNTEIVRHANLDDLILISRDSLGDSVISKPGEEEEISRFLKHNLGIEELYIQNILEKYSKKANG